MAAAAGQRAGLDAVSLSRPFLCFRLFLLTASFRQYLFLFLVPSVPRTGKGRIVCRDWSKYPVWEKAGLPRPAGSDVTVAATARWNGRWVQVPAWPGPGCGTNASGERQRQLLRAWRPVGRALGSEPIALAWSSPLYLVRITYPAPHPETAPSHSRGEEEGPAVPYEGDGGRGGVDIYALRFPKSYAPFSPGSSSPFPYRAGQLASPLQLSEPCLQTWIMTSKRINCEYFIPPSSSSIGAPSFSFPRAFQSHKALLLSGGSGVVLKQQWTLLCQELTICRGLWTVKRIITAQCHKGTISMTW